MDSDAFTAALLRWDPRGMIPSQQQHNNRLLDLPVSSAASVRPREQQLGSLEELFQAYGIRYYTGAKIAELGFTVTTLVNMKEEELEDMMNSVYHIFRWELLVGERYGIKAAVRAERRRLEEIEESRRMHQFPSSSSLDQTNTAPPFDALSQEGLSEEGAQQDMGWVVVASEEWKKTKQQRRRNGKRCIKEDEDDGEEEDEEDDRRERSREHPFIVTEPGEVARGKKNGLDYLFHLYHLCADFLLQVQDLARQRGEKCPTKVTNQVFRYAKKAGATYINKPKMRHYVHCYALHCLDEEASNSLRRAFKERGENVGAWRQACYRPLVLIASHHSWDIDSIFNAHPRLSIWYVPTKLRQLCHFERSNAAAADAVSTTATTLRFS